MLSAPMWCLRASRKKQGAAAGCTTSCIRRVLGDALDYLDALPLKDRPALMGAAAKRGYILTLAEEGYAQEARDVLMSELAENE